MAQLLRSTQSAVGFPSLVGGMPRCLMIAPVRPPGLIALRWISRRGRGAFTLVEMLVVLAVLAVLTYAATSAFQVLGHTQRMTMAQVLAGAVEEARSRAMQLGSPCVLAFREQPDDVKQFAVREFGVMEVVDGRPVLQWRRLPQGIVMWDGLPPATTAGTNVMSTPVVPVRAFGLGLEPPEDGIDACRGLMFDDLGKVVWPSAAPGATGVPSAPGPYYLALIEENELKSDLTPAAKAQFIEIRPATGRASLLP